MNSNLDFGFLTVCFYKMYQFISNRDKRLKTTFFDQDFDLRSYI